MHDIGIATLNINGIRAPTRVGMLSELINKHELDILFLQEVTNPDTLNFRGYETHYNVGTSMRGTAIIARKAIPRTSVHKLPSGRAMSAEHKGISLINVYAPSGSARRIKRENFYNTELPAFLYTGPSHTILGGNFNCVLNPADKIGPFQPSRALSDIVSLLVLFDTWTQDPL
jgi:exonuclease III